MLDQPWLGLPDRNGFVQGTDGKRLLHPISRFPADNPARIEIANDGQIQPALAGPDITDIRTPFLIRSVTAEVLIQHVRSHGVTMVTGCRALKARLLAGFETILHAFSALFGDDLPQYLPHSARHAGAGYHKFHAIEQTGCECAPE